MNERDYTAGGMPLGLAARLQQNMDAFTRFGTLSSEQKDKIISYIKDSRTGRQAEQRIAQTVENLENNTKMWFYD